MSLRKALRLCKKIFRTWVGVSPFVGLFKHFGATPKQDTCGVGHSSVAEMYLCKFVVVCVFMLSYFRLFGSLVCVWCLVGLTVLLHVQMPSLDSKTNAAAVTLKQS